MVDTATSSRGYTTYELMLQDMFQLLLQDMLAYPPERKEWRMLHSQKRASGREKEDGASGGVEAPHSEGTTV